MKIPKLPPVTLKEILEQKYPNIKVSIKEDHQTDSIEIEITKSNPDGGRVMGRARITRAMLEDNPESLTYLVETTLKKIDEWLATQKRKEDNPSSRWFK